MSYDVLPFFANLCDDTGCVKKVPSHFRQNYVRNNTNRPTESYSAWLYVVEMLLKCYNYNEVIAIYINMFQFTSFSY